MYGRLSAGKITTGRSQAVTQEHITSSLSVGKVFVPGGQPTITYYPRDSLGLEDKVRDYLEERHKILSVSGPTKCGKTVLLKTVLEKHSPLWLSGGDIKTIDSFWEAIADKMNVFPDEESADATAATTGKTAGGGFSVAPFNVGLKGDIANQTGTSSSHTGRTGRHRPISMATKEALSRSKPILVIDDFHYIPSETQQEIVRGLKDLVFEGLPVLIAAVPHRAYDAVRVEKEMTGRVNQLKIDFWKDDELDGIAREGFEALNVRDETGLGERLAKESFHSPHLMQEFCLHLCKDNGVRERVAETQTLRAPDWNAFFRARASQASKSAFDLLARGPRQRSDRKERVLVGGEKVDIYGAVLAAIAETGPLTELTYEGLRGSLRKVMDSDPPQRHEVTRVLEELARIAKEQIEGEPVVDYDTALATLYISDPFFAYFLRWGVRTTPGNGETVG